MKCETLGALRAYLDGELDPFSIKRLEQHLVACLTCRERLQQVRANATSVAFHLRSQTPEEVVAQEERVWATLQGRIDQGRVEHADRRPAEGRVGSGKDEVLPEPQRLERRRRMPVLTFALRQRSRVAAAIAAVFLVVIIPAVGLTVVPAGRATAVEFLKLFRPQRFEAVAVDPNLPFDALGKLESLGIVQMPEPRTYSPTVTDLPLDQVGANAGLKVRRPTALPAGIADSPTVLTTRPATASFTLDRQKAEAYLRSAAAPNTNVPAQLDGARLVIDVPSAVIQMYGDVSGQPQLVVAQLSSPTAVVEGNANLDELRNFLLSVPGLPADTVAQLRSIDDWTTTVPIPIPRDQANSQQVSINDAQGLLVSEAASGANGLIWEQEGVVFGIVGMVPSQQLVQIAQSLQ